MRTPRLWTQELEALRRRKGTSLKSAERLLTETGFRGVEFYGTYGFAPYDAAESDRLIAVAH